MQKKKKKTLSISHLKKKMLVVIIIFSWYSLNYDVAFKLTNKLKVNNDNFKFNGNFKSHITIGRTPGEHYNNT
jgi:hypothetical protein